MRVENLTEAECKRELCLKPAPALRAQLEARIESFTLKRARSNAMAVLLQQSIEHRLRCAAGLLFSAACDAADESPSLQGQISSLSVSAEAIANEISHSAVGGAATAESGSPASQCLGAASAPSVGAEADLRKRRKHAKDKTV